MNNQRIVITCRVAYLHWKKPYSFSKSESDANKKYMATLIIPKGDRKSIEKINKAIEKALQNGCKEKWNGKKPSDFKSPLKDGDEREDGDETFANSFYITAKSKTAPEVVDQELRPIYDGNELYSGCYCNVSFTLSPYTAGPHKGVTAILGNIQLVKKGNMIGRKCRAVDEFKVITDTAVTEFNVIKDDTTASPTDTESEDEYEQYIN